MSRRSVLVLAVCTALVAVVAVAARSHPLGSNAGRGAGLPSTFWDFALTSVVIVGAAGGLIGLFEYARVLRGQPPQLAPYASRTARTLAVLVGVVALFYFITRFVDLRHLFHPAAKPPPGVTVTVNTNPSSSLAGGDPASGKHGAHLRWEEFAVVLAALVAIGSVAAARSRKRLVPQLRRTVPEVFAAALDDSIDDLRDEPDVRRAIVAAYARMEGSLAAAGLPRRQAEAPLEYLARVLVTLDVRKDAVVRLTDLFEWARFSHHEPEPSMRDEAIDALVAVRDELRAPVEAQAA